MLSERFDQWEKEFKTQGAASVITRLAQKRFGDLPESVHDTLNNATPEQIESWVERLLDVASLDVASLDDLFSARRTPVAP